MNDHVLVRRLHVELARAVYPSVITYVERAQRYNVGVTGLCGHMAVPVSELLLEYKRLDSSNVPECQRTRDTATPFNCFCGGCDVESYSTEGRSGNRLNNPYRRKFINWVCQMVDQPELLP